MIPEFPSYMHPMLSGFSETIEPVMLRTEFDAGPARQRSYQCGSYIRRSLNYTICGCENMELWRRWFLGDIRQGSLWFKWFDPCSEKTVRARIYDGTYSATPDNTSLASWTISLNFEVWASQDA